MSSNKQKIYALVIAVLLCCTNIYAQKAYTYHENGKTVVMKVPDLDGTLLNRLVVYPDTSNNGIPVEINTYNENDCFITCLYYENVHIDTNDNVAYLSACINEEVTDSVILCYLPCPDFENTIIHNKQNAIILQTRKNWVKVKVLDDDSNELSGWIKYPLKPIQSHAENVFTVHNPDQIISLYSDKELSRKRIDIYPYKAESDAGVMLIAKRKIQNVFEIEYEGELLYCEDGCLYINTRNYDASEMYLYSEPDSSSTIVGISNVEQTALVLDISGEWLKIHALMNDNSYMDAWIPRDMQCPSPWTTCG